MKTNFLKFIFYVIYSKKINPNEAIKILQIFLKWPPKNTQPDNELIIINEGYSKWKI